MKICKRHARQLRLGVIGGRLYAAEGTPSQERAEAWMTAMRSPVPTWRAFRRTYNREKMKNG